MLVPAQAPNNAGQVSSVHAKEEEVEALADGLTSSIPVVSRVHSQVCLST